MEKPHGDAEICDALERRHVRASLNSLGPANGIPSGY